jgi:hypothetical protein
MSSSSSTFHSSTCASNSHSLDLSSSLFDSSFSPDSSFIIPRKASKKQQSSSSLTPVRDKKKSKSIESENEINELNIATLKTKRTRRKPALKMDNIIEAINEMRSELSDLKKENQVFI